MFDVDGVSDHALEYLSIEKAILIEDDNIVIDDTRMDVLRFYSRLIQEFFESYLVVFDSIDKVKAGKQQKKEFIVNLRKNGIRMYHTGEIRLAESLSMPGYENALRLLRSRKIIEEEYVNKRNIVLTISDPTGIEPLRDEVSRYLQLMVQ